MFEAIKNRAKKIKEDLAALYIAYKDPRTPFLPKLLLGLTLFYMLSPIDLIPDFIPLLGLLDDLIIVPALISLSIKYLPADILKDARAKVADSPQIKKNNWLMAVIIILFWLLCAFLLIRLIRSRGE